jgi:hypothetical protein
MKQLRNITGIDLFHIKSGSGFPTNTWVPIDQDRLFDFVDSQMETWVSVSSIEYDDGIKTWDPSEQAWQKFSNPADQIDYRYENKEPTGFRFTNGNICTDNEITFDDSTRTFTISAVSGADDFEFFCAGERVVKSTPESIQIPDLEGAHFIYYVHHTLTTSQTPWPFGEKLTFVTIVDWDQTNQKRKQFEEERHGYVMDWATHQNKHRTEGSKIGPFEFELTDYVLKGDGSLDSHAQIGIAGGNLYDEDIIMSIVNSATPTNAFEQVLSPIGRFPIFYKKWEAGIGMNAWRVIDPTNFAVASNAPNPIFYNRFNAGQWTLQAATNGYYVAMWLLVSNNRDVGRPVILILGQAQSESLLDANNDNLIKNLDLTDFGSPEKFKKYRFIFRTDTAYTNTVKASLISFNDVAQEPPIVSGVVPPFVFSKDGGTGVGTYLRTGAVQTDRTGQPIKGTNFAVEIRASNLNNVANTTRIQFTRRTGRTTRTDITDLYVDIPAGTYFGSRTSISILVGPDWEIGCYNKSGSSVSDVVVIIYLTN